MDKRIELTQKLVGLIVENARKNGIVAKVTFRETIDALIERDPQTENIYKVLNTHDMYIFNGPEDEAGMDSSLADRAGELCIITSWVIDDFGASPIHPAVNVLFIKDGHEDMVWPRELQSPYAPLPRIHEALRMLRFNLVCDTLYAKDGSPEQRLAQRNADTLASMYDERDMQRVRQQFNNKQSNPEEN